MDSHAVDFADKVKFLVLNIDHSATEAASKEFMERNEVRNSTGAFAPGGCPDFFKMYAYPWKALVKADGTCAANFRFREVGGKSGDRVGSPEDLNTLV
mmetsp:Transcript_124586/g.215900  ORF Transcript_124586/g.215900 Transcript_124586/m.215900 type:complete len:98 (-) Transcript_124586:136-429(-)